MVEWTFQARENLQVVLDGCDLKSCSCIGQLSLTLYSDQVKGLCMCVSWFETLSSISFDKYHYEIINSILVVP